MGNILKRVLLAALSIPLIAQDYGWRGRGDSRSYPGDYRYGNNTGYGRRSNSAAVVERTLIELQRLGSRGYMDRKEREHVGRAINELQEFRSRFQQGRWDNGRLDRAIDSLKRVANARQIDYRERDLVARHIEDLRAFRATGGRF